MDTDFFVYFHKRLGSGVPFYVGKGRKDRARSYHGRNAHWKRVVAKDGGRDVGYIAKNVDNEFALLAEVEAIDLFRRMGFVLANLTDGGDGTSGYSMSEDTKKKIAATKIGRRHSEDSKRRMSAVRKGMPGHPLSEANKLKLLVTHLGQPSPARGVKMSEQSKQNVRDGVRAYRLTAPPDSAETRFKKGASTRGKPRSAETIAKLSAAKSGKRLSPESLLRRREKMKRVSS